MKFNKTYFLLFVLLFLTEIAIAVYLNGGFIRHTLGDFLAVLLLYCFFKSFWDANPWVVAFMVLIIAFTIEFLQLTKLLSTLHLEENKMTRIVFGQSFDPNDLLAYTLGVVTILILELKLLKQS